mmetsp:Transcript_102295/g.292817  ORF Transcript_102295/g.292817 Transcript_102295/m.292817 type:complete len:347 (-) Transcript_102295:311-1351(-)
MSSRACWYLASSAWIPSKGLPPLALPPPPPTPPPPTPPPPPPPPDVSMRQDNPSCFWIKQIHEQLDEDIKATLLVVDAREQGRSGVHCMNAIFEEAVGLGAYGNSQNREADLRKLVIPQTSDGVEMCLNSTHDKLFVCQVEGHGGVGAAAFGYGSKPTRSVTVAQWLLAIEVSKQRLSKGMATRVEAMMYALTTHSSAYFLELLPKNLYEACHKSAEWYEGGKPEPHPNIPVTFAGSIGRMLQISRQEGSFTFSARNECNISLSFDHRKPIPWITLRGHLYSDICGSVLLVLCNYGVSILHPQGLASHGSSMDGCPPQKIQINNRGAIMPRGVQYQGNTFLPNNSE